MAGTATEDRVPLPDKAARPAESAECRSRLIYWLWGIGLSLLAGLGVICWLLVLPAIDVAAATLRLGNSSQPGRQPADLVDQVGGPGRALRGIRVYMLLPDRWAPRKWEAACLLDACGEPALTLLCKLLAHPDESIRGEAAGALGELGPAAARAVPALRELSRERLYRAEAPVLVALWRISGDARSTFPRILAIIERGDWRVSGGACDLLERYREDAFPVIAGMLASGEWKPVPIGDSFQGMYRGALLEKMRQDPRPEVSRAAGHALESITGQTVGQPRR